MGEPGSYRAGLVTFAAGDINCSAIGQIEAKSGLVSILPRGEGACRIPLSIEGNTVRIGQVPEACSYYCGPGATMAGKTFNRAEKDVTAVDLAGDPLC
jgi:hypothetical protein